MGAPLGNQFALGNDGGRPTKLTPEVLEKARGYVQWCEENPLKKLLMGGKEVDAKRPPTVAGLACHLKVGKRTIYDWEKENKEISHVLEDIRATAERILSEQGLTGNYNPLMAKFLLSADHDKREKSDVTSDGKALPAPIYSGRSEVPVSGHDSDEESV